MGRGDKLMVVDKLEREIADVAKERNSSDNQQSLDDLSRGLHADRQRTTLTDLNHRLLSIDERLGHIQENTSTKIMADYFLNAIKANTKATEVRARDIQGNVFIISLIVIFGQYFTRGKITMISARFSKQVQTSHTHSSTHLQTSYHSYFHK